MNATNTTQKKDMLDALERALGIVSTAADKAGIHRATHYRWLQDDPEYKAAVDQIQEGVIDFAESHLYKLIKEGNPAANIFYLKTKGKSRGYIERQEVEVSGPKPLSWFDDAG